MATATSPQSPADKYYERMKQLYPATDSDIVLWPGYASLRDFMNEKSHCGKPPVVSIITIPGESSSASNLSISPDEGAWKLLQNLPSLDDTSTSSHLILVENICPRSLAVLGGTYDVDPQFFADHINVLSWYQMYEKVPDRLPPLPSTKKMEDFLSFHFVQTREIKLEDDTRNDASSVLWPDPKETRIIQSAGKLEPFSIRGETYARMAFTRQTVSVWCQQKKSGSGWISIMLFNPPFKLRNGLGRLIEAEYRNPNLRPGANEPVQSDIKRRNFSQAFYDLLQQRCSTDTMYRKTCATDSFLVLFEAYRIVASEWLVNTEYVKRELANIERQMEKPESTFSELENHLKALYRIRRRCNKDYELVTEASKQCQRHGQSTWPSSRKTQPENVEAIDFVERHAQGLDEDLKYVLDNMAISISRIEKDITLLIGLVALTEGRQGIQENRGIALFTLIAIIFLPSETVATILGVQTQYGPGASGFWILWAIAIPLTVLVVSIPYLYAAASTIAKQELEKYGQWRAKREERRKKDWLHVLLQGDLKSQEGIDISDYPIPHMRHASMNGVV